MGRPQLVNARWQKSSHSGSNADCVEAASGLGHVAVRDSKNPTGNVLLIDGAQWTAFLDAIKNGYSDG